MAAQPKATAVEKKNVPNAQEHIDQLVARAKKAQAAFMDMTQEQIDTIVQQMALAGLDKHMHLAKMAVEETGRGVYEDKITKNIFATEYIFNSIKYEKTVGVIEDNPNGAYMKIAEPVGIVMGITPVTNPTSTTMFKALISIKTRNPIIFGFHPSAQKCSAEAARILRDAAVKYGAPEHCIQWIEYPSMDATNALMNHPDVALILATGGAGMVRAAYSCGKPALGVGPGNVPCFIDKTADLEQAVTDLILSKTFDNGMICASEQAVIIEEPVFAEAKKLMQAKGCRFLTKEETGKLQGMAMKAESCAVNPAIVGQSAKQIAEMAGISVPDDTKILVAELDGVGPKYPLSAEKLSPVLACYKVKNAQEGIDRAAEVVAFGGMGHSSVIHSHDDDVIGRFADRLQTGRILVNSPSTHGAIGDIYNTNIPSLTLGCGSYGRNSTSSNVTAVNLLNIKRVAKRTVNMQWFKVPNKIYFEKGATQYLAKMPDIHRVMIVTDAMMVKLGYVEKLEYYLRQRRTPVAIEVFSDVEPDPSTKTVERGAEMMRSFEPDCIIALGGGSPMDAAKGMWLFYEYPDTDFDNLKQKFLDIRKRTFKYPRLGQKAKFVAIPTTSGTGSEVTSFAVITDKEKGNTKYPLADYELTPDVAIIDPEFVYSLPKTAVADTGMDVLTHAIEAYVSVMASDYTDGLAIKAIQLVFENLVKSYREACPKAREKMHNASTLAGMAFANAFLGINHSLAHKWGAQYHTAHGRTNAILMPHVIRYNAKKPTKFASFPKYDHFVADVRYAEIARILGLPARTTEEGVKSLIEAIRGLNRELGIPESFQELGFDAKDFESRVDYLADRAFEDQCTTANPKLPLVSELAEVYRDAFYGRFE
ncbi:bifunctional acetaldehyde-CoA/alcohol dehydrogenase [Paenibacillus melissococcoides]|uniref:Aldehyde-alcohol dehydrogenase n=1 Tax=Paenibacillus melissococcoides TaxID=2912268 RepID=A0ABM9G2M6_9BACL|nr:MULTISPECIES: bifunctional acetaldehyde-CoA/alcohol dehydrogenase [Paenibacillus]MEB9892016.1 bifunctional acetaldehyde-CoA/alcohol dehydrogenase [Bacillus cereus]CAH8245451.1 bifunctional acetaldehyde-CoA/alcohol dehydrogenase [Paenibacillus melissococcoides]CAH8710982.1 bifunctional acetaldehyde-CoA/alcohol dehydrogenase [Paenibacillus melissococcoides]CAH8711772.1 bifunctional acetaldehyde-CoA/alcohol dehydrogenase [Paenibacillus melissococcoides]GIO78779.1 aldehyde-alcohol dehydrogenase